MAVLAIFSAAARYFSMSTGDTESTSAMLSKPYPESSTGKSAAGWKGVASRSRTVALYSYRFSRRAVWACRGRRSASMAANRTIWFQCSGGGRGLGSGGWGRSSLGSDLGDGEDAAMAGEGNSGDAGEGLVQTLGSGGEGGERSDGAELSEKHGRVAGPGVGEAQKSVESIAQGVGAQPHGFGVGDGVHDSCG